MARVLAVQRVVQEPQPVRAGITVSAGRAILTAAGAAAGGLGTYQAGPEETLEEDMEKQAAVGAAAVQEKTLNKTYLRGNHG